MKNGAFICAVVFGLVACSDSQEAIDSVNQPVINGAPFSPEGLYYVNIRHGGPGTVPATRPYNICSGTLVRNDAVLTARHCVTYNRSITGAIDTNLHDFELLIGSQTSGVREILELSGDPGKDAVLIITNRFFTLGGHNVGWRVPIYPGSSSSLVGVSLFCAGYGVNSAAADPATAEILRYAWLTPDYADPTTIRYPMNTSGQIIYKGDSGGSCIFTGAAGTALQVTGVNSLCAGPSGPCTQVAPEQFRATANAALAARGAGFVHKATSANTSSHVTTIDHPDTNDKPNAVVSVTANWNPNAVGGTYNNHHFGIYYAAGRWRVFNQDFAAMPANAAFNVSVGAGFVHRTTTANTVSNSTTLDHPALNNNPNAAFIVTPVWNPPGSSGVYNNHATGVWYDGSRWNVFNEDNASMPLNTGFSVRIDRSSSVRASATTVSGNWVWLNDPNLNGHPEAQIFVTPNFNPGGVLSGYMHSPVGVWYSTASAQWGIYRQDLGAMPSTAGFNVLYRP